ncbi:MAG: hypothetical protein LBH55_01605 [Mycoplasmataceae bacterium]|jgi:hypothetical protein|nr:hypothetical protein [Mycoplasmataceae bacterium]
MKQKSLKSKKWIEFINNFNYEKYNSLLLKIEDMVYFIGLVGEGYGEYKWKQKEKYGIFSFSYDWYDEGNVISVDEKECAFYNNWEEMFYNAKINGMFIWEAIIDEDSRIVEYNM